MPRKKPEQAAKAVANNNTTAAAAASNTAGTTTTAAAANATIELDLQSYKSTRDQVVTGLATIQDVIKTLSESYIRITNKVLGEYGEDIRLDAALQKLGDLPMIREATDAGPYVHANQAQAAALEDVAVDGKKEKKKRPVDPNAPKRPLTAFFLYMKFARAIIQKEMGHDAKPREVADEGAARWAAMGDTDKQTWSNYYKQNLRLYNARVHAYKHGNEAAKDMDEEEANAYADEHNITSETENHHGPSAAALRAMNAPAAPNHVLGNTMTDAEGDSVSETEVPVAPSPKKNARKGKAATAAEKKGAAANRDRESILPPPEGSGKKETPAEAKKRKRAADSKKADGAAAAEVDDTPKPKKRKAKGKGD